MRLSFGIAVRGSLLTRCLWATALLAISLLRVATSSAQESPPPARLHLQYESAVSDGQCPTEAEWRDSIASRLGYDPFVADTSAPRSVRIRIARERRQYQAAMEIREGSAARALAQRELSSRDCRELLESLAVAVSLNIDPESLTRPQGQVRPDPTPIESPPVLDPPPPVERPPVLDPPLPPVLATPTPPLHTALILEFDVTGAIGILPNPSLALSPTVGLQIAQFGIRATGYFDIASDTLRTASGARMEANYYGGELGLCFDDSTFLACALGGVGVIRSRGLDVTDPRSESPVQGYAGARAGYALTLTKELALAARLDVLVPFVRYNFELDGQTAWTSSAVAGRVSLGVQITL